MIRCKGTTYLSERCDIKRFTTNQGEIRDGKDVIEVIMYRRVSLEKVL